jgi:RNA polymerase sigma-32 factor
MNVTTSLAPLRAYRADIGHHPPLDPVAEHDLAVRFRAGDRDAGRRLVEACLPFVMAIAFEYARWGAPIEDVVQEGNVGLLKAAARFDPERGTRLAPYAAYAIRAEIREYLARSYRMVRLDTSKGVRRALRIYRRTRETDPEALARMSGLSVDRAAELLPLLMSRDTSLDRAANDDAEAPIERLADRGSSPEEETCAVRDGEHLRAALTQALGELGARDRVILAERWLTEEPKTLEELSVVLGVSRERVRQLEERAKKQLRGRIEELIELRPPRAPVPSVR